MKPSFRIHFSDERPNRPGLWVSRRNRVITVLEVDASDIDREKRVGNWLDGEWGGVLEVVDRDVVPLDRKRIQEHLDKLINDANQNAKTDVCAALQALRKDLLGAALDLPETPDEQSEPDAVEEVRPPERGEAGSD